MSDMFKQALASYNKYGFQLVPLIHGRKEPAVPQLEPYFSNRIETNLEQGKNNIGVITGAISQLIVIDIDSNSAEAVFLHRIAKVPTLENKLKITLGVKTANGIHFYLRPDVAEFPAGIDTAVLFNGPDGEIRVKGNRGYVVGAGSLHPSGKYYESNNKELQKITRIEWLELCAAFNVENNGKIPVTDFFKSDFKLSAGNNRHEAVLRVMESLLKRNTTILDEEAIKKMAVDWNQKHCVPPIAEADFERNWTQALKFIRKKGVIEDDAEIPLSPSDDLKKETSFDEIAEILSSTIKNDVPSKLISFCAMLLSQTKDDQINIGFQAESSAGKSYIPLELSAYFPSNKVEILAGATPTAFFYEYGKFDEAAKVKVVDKEGKIMIFTDMPDYRLMEKLRSFLSHDKKELTFKLTNRGKGGQHRVDTVILRGYATVIFCTAALEPDEQEKTRLLLLSPDVDESKIDEALRLLVLKKGNAEEFTALVLTTKERAWLKERIKAIIATGINDIIIQDPENTVLAKFRTDRKFRLARHLRDLPRIMALIKAHALLNCFNREKKNGHGIIATETDIEAGFKLYSTIEKSNEFGLSPYIYSVYSEIIAPLISDGMTVTTNDFLRKFYEIRHKFITQKTLSEILKQIELAGLIEREADPTDKRRMLIRSMDAPAGTQQSTLVQTRAAAGADNEFLQAVNKLLELDQYFVEHELKAYLPGWDELNISKALASASKKGLLIEKHGQGKWSKA